jgi:hypothetical protein
LPKVEAGGKNSRGHMVDIPRIIFSTQRRDWVKEPFMDGRELGDIMAETIDEITIQYEEEGLVVVEELDKVVLNRGAWTTILFRYRERDRKTGDFGPPKAGLRRYQKTKGLFRKRDAINLSPDAARQLIATLGEWFVEEDG